MSRRSNEFQRLITGIYDAMTSVEGGNVSESAILTEPSGIPREIDVLIEKKLYGHNLRIAVECRDRFRKDDVEWIDSLLGKYKNLEVHKIIAVSRSGFSASAKQKASDNGIEVKTLEECLDTDWPDEFIKIGIGVFEISFQPESISFELLPPLNSDLKLKPDIENSEGKITGAVQTMLVDCFNRSVLTQIKEFIDKEFLPSCKVIADLQKRLELTVPVDITDVFLSDTDGSRFELKRMTYLVKAHTQLFHGSMQHYRYGDNARVSVSTIDSPDMTRSFKIIQVAGSKSFNVTIERVRGNVF